MPNGGQDGKHAVYVQLERKELLAKLHCPPVYWKRFDDILVSGCISFICKEVFEVLSIGFFFPHHQHIFHAILNKIVNGSSTSTLILVRSE